MAYQSLYRRYRSRRFGELVGQPHVVMALRNAVKDDRVGHAYLFSGPRGTGKTSTARILAKVLNCEAPVDGEPCCTCASCLAVEAGTSFDVHELDAASNNGVENIRDLIEKANLATPGRTKVYILDEVHMLSKPAEAALLKTLEEPPPNVVFVLATTDPQKVTATIRSRCQPFEFHLIANDELEAHVRWIVADAGLPVGDDGIEAALRLGKGSARDTLSALDQVVAAGGVVLEQEPLDDLVEALVEGDTALALAAVAREMQAGRDARTLAEHLVTHLRDAFLSLLAPELVQLPDRTKARVIDQGRRLGAPATVRAMEVLGEMLVDMRHAPEPRLLLDVALVRLTNAAADTSPAALLQRIERLERSIDGGATRPEPRREPDAPVRTVDKPLPARAQVPEPPEPLRRPASTPESTVDPSARAPKTRAEPAARAPGTKASLGERARGSTAPASAPPPAPVVANIASAGEPPTRDELTLAWADAVLPRLPPRSKAVFMAGRWVDTPEGTPTLALPNEPHRVRCEPLRADVEAALAAQFGRPVTIRLVADAGQVAYDAPTGGPPADEDVDPSELIDAAPVDAASIVERVVAAFPGAQLLEEG
jgi:DNA polymerase III subunit gamma/tau